jgi:septal ring factor EnvC (AmiA/AmiB activator)
VRTEAIGELRRASDQLEKLLSDGTEGAVDLDIRRFRGLLDPPPGKLLRPFGDRIDPRFGTRLPHPGWDLDLPFAAPVPAIWSGRVVYADWFRGYGLTVVLDHGQGIHSVYAHLSAIVTPSGTQVAAGESVGRVGDTGSLEGPFLYFELRQRGKAVDPAEWFKR